MRFHYTIHHVPGKTLYTADTLSRAPLQEPVDESSVISQDTEQFVQSITDSLPATAKRLKTYAEAQARDNLCTKLIEFCTSGWPHRNQLSRGLKEYWKYPGSLQRVITLSCHTFRFEKSKNTSWTSGNTEM